MREIERPARDSRTVGETRHDEATSTAVQPQFRTDLYRGTAPYYDRYRPPYPAALLDECCDRMPATGTGRLLDLACGTGQLAIPLASRFAEVIAVDQEPETVAFGEAKARALDIDNVRWMVGAAEQVELDPGFEAIVIGTAFQRLPRQVVARRMWEWLQPGGAAALVWSDIPWNGELPWQKAFADLVIGWLGEVGTNDRMPAGWEEAMKTSHEQVLRDAGFTYEGKVEMDVEQSWTLESLFGFMGSTSILSLEALGDRAGRVERELAEVLAPFADADGRFYETASFAYELARRS